MATEFEELKLTVTLVDNATTGLEKIQGAVDKLGGAEHAKRLEGTTKETKELTEAFGKLGEAFGFSLEKMLPLFRTFAGIAGPIGAFAFAVDKAKENLGEFAEKMLALDVASQKVGANSAQFRTMVETFRASGVSAEAATRNVQGLYRAMADLAAPNSPLRQKLMVGAGLDPAQAEAMERSLMGMSRSDIVEFANQVRHNADLIYENMYKHEIDAGKTADAAKARAAEVAERYVAAFNAPELRRVIGHFHAPTPEEVARGERNSEIAREYATATAEGAESWERISQVMARETYPTLKAMLETTNAWLKAIAEGMESAEEKKNKLREKYKPTLWDKWNPFSDYNFEVQKELYGEEWGKNPFKKPLDPAVKKSLENAGSGVPLLGNYGDITGSVGGGGTDYSRWSHFPASKNIEDRRGEAPVGDPDKLLTDNTEQLKRLNDFLEVPNLAGGAQGLLGGGTPGGALGNRLGGVGPGPGGMRAGGGGSRGGGGGGDGGGGNESETPPDTTPEAVRANLAASRARFAKELEAKPWLRDKLLGIAAGENRDPAANQSVMEETMNRAAVSGHTLEQEARTTAEGGYYAGYNPGALRNRAFREASERRLKEVLEGSNRSNFATDNSSGDLARRERGSGRFVQQYESGGEHFFSPGTSGNFSRRRWLSWRNAMMQTNDHSNPTAGTPTTADDPRYATGVEMLRQQMNTSSAGKRAAADDYSVGVNMLREQMSRELIDRQMTHRVEGAADINVSVDAPRGTQVTANRSGLFRNLHVQRKYQMEPAASSEAAGP